MRDCLKFYPELLIKLLAKWILLPSKFNKKGSNRYSKYSTFKYFMKKDLSVILISFSLTVSILYFF